MEISENELRAMNKTMELSWFHLQNVLKDIDQKAISPHTISQRHNILCLMNDMSHYTAVLNKGLAA